MRHSLILAVLAVAACSSDDASRDGGDGRDTGAPRDAPGMDAPSPDDSGPDSDAPSDAPSIDAPAIDAPRADVAGCTTPDLAITLTDSMDPVSVRDIIEIRVTVTNSGDTDATAVVASLELDDFQPLSGNICVVALSPPYNCPFATIAAGTSRMGWIRGRIDVAGAHTTHGTVYGRELDCDASDNVVDEVTTVTP